MLEELLVTSPAKNTDFSIKKISTAHTVSNNQTVDHSFIGDALQNTKLSSEVTEISHICTEQPHKIDMNQFSDNDLFMPHHGTRIFILQMKIQGYDSCMVWK